jgi:hypothetical protein
VALKWLGEDVDTDEVECILSTLIYQGYIAGYISHAAKKVVVSNRAPFPKINSQHTK